MAAVQNVPRPHIPNNEVPELIGWPCADCPNSLRVAQRIKRDSIQVMDGNFTVDDLWIPEDCDPLATRKVILIQLGRKISSLYASNCQGTKLDEEFQRRFGHEKKLCGSESEIVLSRLDHAVMSGRSNYGHGLQLTPAEIYTSREVTTQAAEKARLKDAKDRKRWERFYG